jgi:hypothetical protein
MLEKFKYVMKTLSLSTIGTSQIERWSQGWIILQTETLQVLE